MFSVSVNPLQCLVNELTSLSHTAEITMDAVTKVAPARQGRKYGNSFQNPPVNVFGYLSLGRESKPPNSGLKKLSLHDSSDYMLGAAHPTPAPTPHATGMSANASARFEESVSSPIVLFKTPFTTLVERFPMTNK